MMQPKPYEDAIQKIAQDRFDADMGGSIGYSGNDVDIVSFIYDVPKDQVYNDVSVARGEIQKAYMEQWDKVQKH